MRYNPYKRCFLRFTLWIGLLWIVSPAVNTRESDASAKERIEELNRLATWQVGTSVSAETIQIFGIDRCFQKEAIHDTVFCLMKGKSFGANCTIPKDSLRYLKLLHQTAEGSICLGEMVCHQQIADDLVSIFRALYEAHYPIECMKLIDHFDANDERSMESNNTSCFNYRTVAGSRTLSQHAKGLAVDVNPRYNPCIRQREGKQIVQPASASAYADRTRSFAYKIEPDDLCCRLFKAYGFKWGGSWRSLKDYQHFEKYITN